MKRIIKRAVIVFIIILAYIIGSLVLPPVFHPKTEDVTLGSSFTGERVACIDGNQDALIWRLRMIENAETEIILSTFGFSTGSSGKDILCALHAAAERGVTVRLLLDGFHGGKTMRDSEEFQALSTLPNVEVRLYNQIDLLQPWKANYRMHDKYLIVDDTMYMLGGRNTNDLFLGNYSATPNIDRDILVIGSGSLAQLRSYFEAVWAQPDCRIYSGKEDTAALNTLRLRYDRLKTAYPNAFGFTDWENQTIPANSVTLLTGSVEVGTKAPTLWKSLCAHMEQGENILIQTPYVICGREMYEDLAALTDGRNVTILTNSPETGANPFGCADYLNQQKKILDTGVSILEYAGDHSLHAKTILIDENISIVGSFNMDMRSAYIDTEPMLVIDCPALNAKLRQGAKEMAADSLRISPDGAETPGASYEKGTLPFWNAVGIQLLRLVEGLFRHLL